MLQNQSHLFQLPDDIIYLNGAYMSPQLKSVEAIGIEALKRKGRPYEISADDFFEDREKLCKLFSDLIGAEDPQRIAIVPSVSYGMANVIKNIHPQPDQEIVLLHEQFPSNYYGWKNLADSSGAKLVIVNPPTEFEQRGAIWNRNLLESITAKTIAVAIAHIHWADGTKFDLAEIRKHCDDVGALLIIDGTQSIGAFPFDVKKYKPDALICGGYKWLLGPYSLGVAYFGEYFDNGTPIENNWINRLDSHKFAQLTSYQDLFQPKAARYGVGESSNFILVPMLIEAIKQLLKWRPEAIQEYCRDLVAEPISEIRNKGYWIEEESQRASHLFGIYLSKMEDMQGIKDSLLNKNIHVSYRGNAIRVSPSIYNSPGQLDALVNSLP